MAASYFDLVPDPRSLSARDYDAEIDAQFEDEPDPDLRLRQEFQALYGEYLDRKGAGWEDCAGCEVLTLYGWRDQTMRKTVLRHPKPETTTEQLLIRFFEWR